MINKKWEEVVQEIIHVADLEEDHMKKERAAKFLLLELAKGLPLKIWEIFLENMVILKMWVWKEAMLLSNSMTIEMLP